MPIQRLPARAIRDQISTARLPVIPAGNLPSGSVLQVVTDVSQTRYSFTTTEVEVLTVTLIAKKSNPRFLIDTLLYYGFADNPNTNEVGFRMKYNGSYINVATVQYGSNSNTFFNQDADYQYATTNVNSSLYQTGRAYGSFDHSPSGISAGDSVTYSIFGVTGQGTGYFNRVGASSTGAGMWSTLKVAEVVA